MCTLILFQISLAIAVAGGVDLATRLIIGCLSDRPSCMGKRGLLLAVTWILEGINSFAFAELSSLSWDLTPTEVSWRHMISLSDILLWL
ncbi:unnamed protein product [Protopolystoma xenopodis]|uniref:Solute carrier family 40 protein n=1 Tax=Protopolystoma xenopodis TaxID=117903 RepID=A0A448WPI0_9PLAT|nr:unnamed protein product [Protopolystoma xenopodis]